MITRNTFEQDGQHARPGAAPRFRDAGAANTAAEPENDAGADAILRRCGFADDGIHSLRQAGIVG